MLLLKEINSNGVAVIEANGKFTVEDTQRIFPQLETALENHEKLHFYIDLRDLSGTELTALKEDLQFDIKYGDRFGRVAIVGERSWQDWATKIFSLFFNTPTRFFEQTETEQAWQWVNGH